MSVDPANHFPHDIREIGPNDCDDCEDRSGQFFRGLCNSAHCCARLVDGAEASLGRAPAAALAAGAKIKAGALISAAGGSARGGQRFDTKVVSVIAGFVDRPNAEFAAGVVAVARSING